MSAEILDGKALAAQKRSRLKEKIAASGKDAFLAVVLVGDDEASRLYDRNKKKAAEELGMRCEIMEFAASMGENALLQVIRELNEDPAVNGILVQLPLPPQINPGRILAAIAPEKDVDGFCPYNCGLLLANAPEAVTAATPKGIYELLKSTGMPLAGKHAVIVGRSNIVGRPLAALLLNQDCTVTVTHSKTRNLPELTRQADILVAACGCAEMIKKDWVKPGAVVIDVGINRIDGRLCGDVDFDEVKEVASFITPVPGGVGPMTVAMLMENTWEAACRQRENMSQEKHACHCSDHEHCHCSH